MRSTAPSSARCRRCSLSSPRTAFTPVTRRTMRRSMSAPTRRCATGRAASASRSPAARACSASWCRQGFFERLSADRRARCTAVCEIRKISRFVRKAKKKLLTNEIRYAIISLAMRHGLIIWRHSSVGRAFGSYPECHLFESDCRYQARWSKG